MYLTYLNILNDKLFVLTSITINTTHPSIVNNVPINVTIFNVKYNSLYEKYRRGIPKIPIWCIGKNVTLTPTNIIKKYNLFINSSQNLYTNISCQCTNPPC